MIFDQPMDVADLTVTMAPDPGVSFGLAPGAAPEEVRLEYADDVPADRYQITVTHVDYAAPAASFPMCYAQGDVNCSGDATGLDLARIQSPSNWNKDLSEAGTDPRADINRSGNMTGTDLAKVQSPSTWNQPNPALTCTCP